MCMVFGIEFSPMFVFLGGVFLVALLTFQILQGMRVIRFKGPLFMKVHRTMAWVIAATAVGHGFAAVVYIFGWRIG